MWTSARNGNKVRDLPFISCSLSFPLKILDEKMGSGTTDCSMQTNIYSTWNHLVRYSDRSTSLHRSKHSRLARCGPPINQRITVLLAHRGNYLVIVRCSAIIYQDYNSITQRRLASRGLSRKLWCIRMRTLLFLRVSWAHKSWATFRLVCYIS